MKFAAIDIGSNAVRLLLTRVFENGKSPIFKKESLVRMPIRLGDDVFPNRVITTRKVEALSKTIKAFKNLIEAYNPLDFRACATSAMREAENREEIIRKIKEDSGIEIKIVDGKGEAEIICSNHNGRFFDVNKFYLYIDVGGGSTEMSLFANGEWIDSGSFNIGTVRSLQGLVTKKHWEEMKKWLKEKAVKYHPLYGIGSGGNINKIFRLARKKEGKPIKRKKMSEIYDYLQSFTYNERIKILGLRPDRADVIIPASQIYLSAMKWGGIKRIYVPQIGLSDGLVRMMYHNIKKDNEKDK